jgi:hypothetical protein
LGHSPVPQAKLERLEAESHGKGVPLGRMSAVWAFALLLSETT